MTRKTKPTAAGKKAAKKQQRGKKLKTTYKATIVTGPMPADPQLTYRTIPPSPIQPAPDSKSDEQYNFTNAQTYKLDEPVTFEPGLYKTKVLYREDGTAKVLDKGAQPTPDSKPLVKGGFEEWANIAYDKTHEALKKQVENECRKTSIRQRENIANSVLYIRYILLAILAIQLWQVLHG